MQIERLIESKPTENNNEKWLVEKFEPRSPIRTAEEFAEKASKRKSEIVNLPDDFLELRNKVREQFGISETDSWVVFGEQPVGLNEPPLVLGKRLLSNYMARHFGFKQLEVFAISDTIGSEAGIFRAELPYPYSESGIHSLHLVSGTKNNHIPAFLLEASVIDFTKYRQNLFKIYGERSYNVHQHLEQVKDEFLVTNQSFASAQKNLLLAFENSLGLNTENCQDDIYLDTLLARKGGLDLILKNWPSIVSTARTFSREGVRVPEQQEAPFFAYFENIKRKLKVYFKNGNLKEYLAYDQGLGNKVIEFNYEDIVGETNNHQLIGVSFRAIPRVILISGVFDAHVTGGGAGYNFVAKPTFEQVFKTPYFPLAWMDLVDETNQQSSLFKYQSLALRKGENKPGFRKAKEHVEKGTVAMLDMAVSLRRENAEGVSQVLSSETLKMSDRIDLR